jgi:hypothetical protein
MVRCVIVFCLQTGLSALHLAVSLDLTDPAAAGDQDLDLGLGRCFSTHSSKSVGAFYIVRLHAFTRPHLYAFLRI